LYVSGRVLLLFDVDYDAYYLNGGYALGLFSPVGTEQASINSLPALGTTTNVVVPLTANILTAGTYQLNAMEVLHFPANVDVLLQDNVTGIVQNLTTNPLYTFTVTGANAQNTRFSLLFRTTGVTGIAASSPILSLDIYPNPLKANDYFTISLPGVGPGQLVAATIYNQLGQSVWQTTLHATLGGIREDVKTTLRRGVYTLQVTLPDGVRQSRRVVIN
jgi:hypothetical protein